METKYPLSSPHWVNHVTTSTLLWPVYSTWEQCHSPRSLMLNNAQCLCVVTLVIWFIESLHTVPYANVETELEQKIKPITQRLKGLQEHSKYPKNMPNICFKKDTKRTWRVPVAETTAAEREARVGRLSLIIQHSTIKRTLCSTATTTSNILQNHNRSHIIHHCNDESNIMIRRKTACHTIHWLSFILAENKKCYSGNNLHKRRHFSPVDLLTMDYSTAYHSASFFPSKHLHQSCLTKQF